MYDEIDYSIWNIGNLLVVYQQIKRAENKSFESTFKPKTRISSRTTPADEEGDT